MTQAQSPTVWVVVRLFYDSLTELRIIRYNGLTYLVYSLEMKESRRGCVLPNAHIRTEWQMCATSFQRHAKKMKAVLFV